MKHLKTYEQFDQEYTETVNEEVKLFGKEIKLWPSYNEILRNKLSFILDADLDNLKAGANQREIKDLMLKMDKATKTDKNSLRDMIEGSQVQEVQSMLKALKELRNDMLGDDKIIGYISYYPDDKKFYYNPGFQFQKG